MFNCLPCNYIHRTDVLCKFQMQVTSNFWNLTALYFHFWNLHRREPCYFAGNWPTFELFTLSKQMTLYKNKFFSYFNGYSSQLLYVQVNTTKFICKHFIQNWKIIFYVRAVKFVLQSVHECNAVLYVRQYSFSPSCNPILHSHILHIHLIPNPASDWRNQFVTYYANLETLNWDPYFLKWK